MLTLSDTIFCYSPGSEQEVTKHLNTLFKMLATVQKSNYDKEILESLKFVN